MFDAVLAQTTAARAAIDVVRNRTDPGGAIIFDHFTGVDRFRYTFEERMATRNLLDDRRFFNLHGTGVFLRQVASPRADVALVDAVERTRT
jgi:hypothetical protein